jgi:hypothetical protein
MTRTIRTEEQIIGILQAHEAGAKCAYLCRKHGMSEGTFYAWKAKYSGMTVSEAKRLKALDRAIVCHWSEDNGEGEWQAEAPAGRADARYGRDEGASVKKVVAPAAKREPVAHLKAQFGLSERRACQIAGADRKTVRYQSRRTPDAALRGRLRDLANERRRFGHSLAGRRLRAIAVRRRLFILLGRQGEPSGIYRLYSEEALPSVNAKRAAKPLE